jgi:Zn ribbon nucleic-acid-binding protein
MLRKISNKGIKCAICNINDTVVIDERNENNKICISCYFKNDEKIPKYIPVEQHDLWIIKNHERGSK